MIEFVIIAVLVTWSAIVVFKKVFPNTAMKVFGSMSQRCTNMGWLTLAKWLKPAAVAGCGGSCGCESKDEPAEKKVEVQAVKWK
ncbi:hypothetical protein EC844_101398 [Acinetobacter calcoaceticus]|uniref:Uncharacterized protein n=1 Tax=Acinetobacter calcoaceticus TaxID=471 RepID=A0A4R1Y755_ACICA|nr:hypothetical protein EC844_101398 [Acinetobacter calcoaceticus]